MLTWPEALQSWVVMFLPAPQEATSVAMSAEVADGGFSFLAHNCISDRQNKDIDINIIYINNYKS